MYFVFHDFIYTVTNCVYESSEACTPWVAGFKAYRAYVHNIFIYLETKDKNDFA